jgi:hypothetical protein
MPRSGTAESRIYSRAGKLYTHLRAARLDTTLDAEMRA